MPPYQKYVCNRIDFQLPSHFISSSLPGISARPSLLHDPAWYGILLKPQGHQTNHNFPSFGYRCQDGINSLFYFTELRED